MDRPRLLSFLRSDPAKLVLVVAPPGFGKTTLVAQWREADERPFAWISLDRGDNDPMVFWSYIVEAIGRVSSAFRQAAESTLRSGADLVGGAVPRILSDLESLDRDVVLVLDDYHWITNPACHESIALFAEHQPSRVQLALCARLDPPIRLGRLRASGALAEIRLWDLSFTHEETEQFLNEVLDLRLRRESVAHLQNRTEGWPAGLFLAYLSMRDALDRDGFIQRFSGSDRHVGDYLSEVVLEALDDDLRAFLLDTSILERMCGPLCDAVTEREDSAELLADIEGRNLFLIPLDDLGEWYRLHHLFAELLRDRLQRETPDRVPELHRRASRWFAMADHPDEAIGHAIAAGDLVAAKTLVAEHYSQMLWRGRIMTILRWLESFPPRAVANDARLSVVKAWVMSFLNRSAEARRALADALDAGYEGSLPDGASSLEASAALIRAGFPWDHVGEMLAAARRAFELEGNRESVWQMTAHVQLGFALYLSGKPDEARPQLEQAADLAPLPKQWMNSFGSSALLARIALSREDFPEAERWARQSIGVVEDHGASDNPQVSYAYTTLGAVLARKGDLVNADRVLTSGLELQRGLGQPLLLTEALLDLAPVRRALGDSRAAFELLEEARTLVDGCRDPGMLRETLDRVSRSLAPRQVNRGGRLSAREIEVLRLLARGLQNREIAAALFVTYNTIHSHIRSIYRKLGTSSRSEAIDRARSEGLL